MEALLPLWMSVVPDSVLVWGSCSGGGEFICSAVVLFPGPAVFSLGYVLLLNSKQKTRQCHTDAALAVLSLLHHSMTLASPKFDSEPQPEIVTHWGPSHIVLQQWSLCWHPLPRMSVPAVNDQRHHSVVWVARVAEAEFPPCGIAAHSSPLWLLCTPHACVLLTTDFAKALLST